MKNIERCLLWAAVPVFLLLPAGVSGPAVWGDDGSIESAALAYIGETADTRESLSGDLRADAEETMAEAANDSSGEGVSEENTVDPAPPEDAEEEESVVAKEEATHPDTEGAIRQEQSVSEGSLDKAMRELEEIKILLQALKSSNPWVRAAAALALGEQEQKGECDRGLK